MQNIIEQLEDILTKLKKEKEPELLPCPFCGGGARLRIWDEENEKNYDVTCDEFLDCPVSPSVKGYLTKFEAIKKWNTRA